MFTLRKVLRLLVEKFPEGSQLKHLLPMPLLFFGLFGTSNLAAQVRGTGVLWHKFGANLIPNHTFMVDKGVLLRVFKRGDLERLTELLSWFLTTSGVARSESTLSPLRN